MYSLVGVIVASTDSIGDFMIDSDVIANMSTFHATSIYLDALMDGITTADSLITFGKLVEKIDNKPLQLPMRDTINIGLGDG